MQVGVRAWCDATQLALTAGGGGRCTPHDHQAGFLRHRAIRVKELLPKQQHTATPAPCREDCAEEMWAFTVLT